MHKNTKSKSLLIILLLSFFYNAQSQNFDFGFQRYDSIVVIKQNGTPYIDPWAGGLNNCQFFEIDLDLNGSLDLVVFDKHGNKTLPFLRFNDCGRTGHFFEPKYNDYLPKFNSWVNSFDYNLDEKKDVFTYTIGGVKAYINTSESTFELREAKSRLTSDYGYGTPINLYTNEADYPGFGDVDGDGAMDIINFWALGKFVELHKNSGLELFGSYDSLLFKLESSCWGHFDENEASNVLELNSNCNSKDITFGNQRHSGSTMLVLDLNGDNLKDIVIGDVDYPHLISLINGGTADSAVMISQDTMFPSLSKPVRLFSMPAATSIDVDFDNIPDLLVSPFDPSRDKAENKNSIWMYKNIGTRSNPEYSFVTSNFLQDRMVDLGSGAYPTLSDINGDGLLDLIVGNWGDYDSSNYIGSFLYSYYSSSLALFLNTGTPQEPIFQLVDSNFANCLSIPQRGCYPTFGDIDGDGDKDLLVGNETGKITFYRNNGNATSIPTFDAPVLNYQNISVHSFSTPQLFDLNKDGLLDLIIGDSLGKIHYYKNQGSASNPIFILATDTLGGVNVRNANVSYYGYSTPCFFTKNDTTFLSVGSESGYLFMYKNIDGNLNGTFTLIDDSTFFVRNQHRVPIYEGIRSGVAVADINGDNLPDIFLGNYSGGVTFYKGTTPPAFDISVTDYKTTDKNTILLLSPNPGRDFVKIELQNNIQSEEIDKIFLYNQMMQQLPVERTDNTININNLPRGVYFIQIVTQNNNMYIQKLVKI